MFRRWLSLLPSHSANVEPSADGVSAHSHGLVIEAPSLLGRAAPTRITFGDIVVKGASDASGMFRVAQAHIDNFQIASGDLRLQIAAVDLKDVALPRSLDARVDPQHPTASLVRFVHALFATHVGAVTLTGINWASPDSAPEAGNSLASLSADAIDAGTVAALSARDFRLNSKAPQSEIRLAQFALTQVSLATLLSLVDPQSYRAVALERPWKPILKRATLSSLDIRTPGGHTALREIELGALEGRMFSFDPTPVLDIAAASPAKLNQQPALAAQFGDGFAASLRIAKTSVREILTDDGTDAPKQRTEADALEVLDLAPRSAKSLSLSALRFFSGDAGIRVGTVKAEDVELAPGASVANNQPAMAIPKFARLTLDQIALVRPGLNASLGTVKVEAGDYVGAAPTHLDASLVGVIVPVESLPNNAIKTNLAALNVGELKLDASVSFSWQEADERFDLSSARLAVADLGALSGTLSLSGVPRAAFEHPDRMADFLAASGLQQARVTFQDGGLAGRVIAKFAEVNKTSAEKIRAALTANMPTLFGAISDATSRNRLIFSAVGFLNDPKTLSVFTTLDAAAPLVKILETWRNAPQNLPGLLRLDAVANRPS